MSAPRPPRVLILDDRRDSASFLCSIFTAHAFESASTSDIHRAMDSVLEEDVDVVVVAYLSDGAATATRSPGCGRPPRRPCVTWPW